MNLYYTCSAGHETSAPYAITKCPTCVKGAPCTGVLKKIGGPRKEPTPRPESKTV